MSVPLVTLASGILQGKISPDYKGREFYNFLGIPYAKAPEGELRFRPPLPAEPWNGIRDASQYGGSCLQKDFLQFKKTGSDDCLYLNVYTQSIDKNDSKPVMVWIHGGGFTGGSGDGNLYGPDYLLTEDIVLVTINYRVGLLGFLSFEDPSLNATGNAGLKDQVFALRWVQENIKSFGGNADNVTIFGESAGGASVHYLVLSPLAKGLFHKAIVQSGVALNAWALGQNLNKDGWNMMGIEGDDPREVLDYLRSLSTDELYDLQNNLKDSILPSCKRYLAPVVEDPNAEQAFITKTPFELLKSGNYNKVPLIIGCTSEEGLMFQMFKKFPSDPFNSAEAYTRIAKNVPHYLNYPEGSKELKLVCEMIKQFYFGGKDITEADKEHIYSLFSDVTFVVDIVASIRYHLKTSEAPLYQYVLSLDQDDSIFRKAFQLEGPGVCHGTDLGYLFKSMLRTEKVEDGSLEEKTIRRFVKLWTNFAKFGNPTPSADMGDIISTRWEPAGKDAERYLDIGEDLQIKYNFQAERMSFWKDIFAKHPALKNYLL